MTKYYRYHRNHGHTTEECKALQDKIEELVRAGRFRRFIRRDDHSSSSRSRHPPRSDHRRQPNDARHNSHPTNPTTNSQSPPAPTSPLPTPPYEAPLTPSLVASQVEAPPRLPERDTFTIYNPSTISLIPTTDAVWPPLYSRMTTSTASTTNRMTPWSSPLKLKIMPLRKSLWIKAAHLTSSTRPPTKNYNFLTPP